MFNNVIELPQFLNNFNDSLLDKISQQNKPLCDGSINQQVTAATRSLLRQPLVNDNTGQSAQLRVVNSMYELLDQHRCGIICGEMGTGKTFIGCALANALYSGKNYHRTLILSPPHLVYKWRREILDTVPGATVWVLNSSDTLTKLLKLKSMLSSLTIGDTKKPEFYVLGRVRMRMGFHWQHSVINRQFIFDFEDNSGKVKKSVTSCAACPDCYQPIRDEDGQLMSVDQFCSLTRMKKCKKCHSPLWSLRHKKAKNDLTKSQREANLVKSLIKLPTIGVKTAERLINEFGGDFIGSMLSDNVYSFVNLMNSDGDFVFNDRQSERIERMLGKSELRLNDSSYQASEYIKRYLPNNFFDLMLVDEAHEYKNDNSAQGQAFGVIANKVRKLVLLTGTLMGGYASDLFFLLWRSMPELFVSDGYSYRPESGLSSSSMNFLRDYGILKDVLVVYEGDAHKTAKGQRTEVRTSKAPGFSPQGILRYILPFTSFIRLSDLGKNALPEYNEFFESINMTDQQSSIYKALETALVSAMREALVKGDNSLIGVTLNTLLAWPDCSFKPEIVKHPRTGETIAKAPTLFDDNTASPKEQKLIDICLAEKREGRRVLVYSTYTRTRDTTSRLKRFLNTLELKTAIMRSSVPSIEREDWVLSQVDKGIDVVITNPELVKTGLDLLEFPTIVFMQSGYNVYTLQQAARRSWRIGQRVAVQVHYLGYHDSAQMQCLKLMQEKISVSQSTSGNMPETGLDILNQGSDSIEMQLAKQLMHTKQEVA